MFHVNMIVLVYVMVMLQKIVLEYVTAILQLITVANAVVMEQAVYQVLFL